MASGFIPAASDLTGDEWVKAQQEIEERRREKAKEGQQEGGKSLFEVLQANKAAKQEAFEESIKLKNQFRTLDNGEVAFLDAVKEGERAREAASKQEIADGLEAFRKQREEAQTVTIDEIREVKQPEGDDWSMKKKRKRDHGAEPSTRIKGRKLSSRDGEMRSTNSSEKIQKGVNKSGTLPSQTTHPGAWDKTLSGSSHAVRSPSQAKQITSLPSAPSIGLGLAAYCSDED